MTPIVIAFVITHLILFAHRYGMKLLVEMVKEHEDRIDASLTRIRELETSVRYLRQRDAEQAVAPKETRSC